MDIELIEIRDFLAEHAPFAQLPEGILDELPKQLTIRYLRRGTPFPPEDETSLSLYIVRKGAVEFRNSVGELVNKLGEGELCHAPCEEDPSEELLTGKVVEDSLFYLLSCERFTTLKSHHVSFKDHFERTLRERLHHALELLQERPGFSSDLLSTQVGKMIKRAPISTPRSATIQQAATVMAQEGVSALLVMDGAALVGVMTDRDLRTRCIAAGLDYTLPVETIMTDTVRVIGRDTTALDALLMMTRLCVRHLPIVDHGRVIGIVSTTDLIRFQGDNAIYLVRDINKSDSIEGLEEISKRLPELQLKLLNGGATALHLGQVLATITDALTQQLIKLAQRHLGPPPCGFAWVAGGSQARREQTLLSDQDNALILSDDGRPEDDRYFAELADYVNQGLARCGFCLCPGNVMASNPEWRQPLKVWRRYFATWIDSPERKALMLANNFFDLRYIEGDEGLLNGLRGFVAEKCRGNKIFLAYMAANALYNRPPLGFFRNLVVIGSGDHANTLDIKHRALIPITDLARVYALSAGLDELATVDRLRASVEAGSLSREGGSDLQDAFTFISTLRINHQIAQLTQGEGPDNYLSPDTLTAADRRHLKDAFGAIATIQESLAQRYQTERFF